MTLIMISNPNSHQHWHWGSQRADVLGDEKERFGFILPAGVAPSLTGSGAVSCIPERV